MEPVETEVVAITSVLSLGILAFLKPAYRNREMPGTVGFIIIVVSVACYSLSTVLSAEATTAIGWVVSQNFVALGATGIAAGWILFAFGYTDVVSVSRRVLLAAVGYVLVVQLLVWTNPFHTSMYPPLSEITRGSGDSSESGLSYAC